MVDEIQIEDFTHELVDAGGGVRFAARQSGLYIAGDAGDDWQLAYQSLGLDEALPTMAVAVSPAYAEDGLVLAGVAGGVMRSQDGGQNWRLIQFHAPAPLVTALGVSSAFVKDGVVLAGTLEDGVFLSDDKGLSWKAWNFGLLDWRVLAMALSPKFAEDRTVYIGTESGLFVSKNGGRSWRALAFMEEPVSGVRFDTDGGVWVEREETGEWELVGN